MKRESITLWVLLLAFVSPKYGMSLSSNDQNDGQNTAPPNGYREGRTDVGYGTYGTTVSVAAQPYQQKVTELENMAYGLSKISSQDPCVQSKIIYFLENKIIRLNLDIANAPKEKMTSFEKSALLTQLDHVYLLARGQAERIFEDMIRYIDLKIPGPNGKQFRTEISEMESSYDPNYRSDRELSQEEQSALYQKLKADFLRKGGSLSEIKSLNAATLKAMGPYTRLEYVWTLDGKVNVTEGKAGHVLLAAGEKVKAAGQIVFLKNKKGEFSLVVVSNSSGNYKPDMLSVVQFTKQLSKLAKVPSEYVVLTKGEPMSTQAIKIYMKGDGIDPSIINQKINSIETEAKDIREPTPLASMPCAFAFF